MVKTNEILMWILAYISLVLLVSIPVYIISEATEEYDTPKAKPIENLYYNADIVTLISDIVPKSLTQDGFYKVEVVNNPDNETTFIPTFTPAPVTKGYPYMNNTNESQYEGRFRLWKK